jgi:SAM-dependent methyltransferase
LRTSQDFDAFYKNPDPWKIGNASRRDKALSRVIGPYVVGKDVLELGCGEGHLTSSIFRAARAIRGVDISSVAVKRATALALSNATFEASNFLNVSFADCDVIAAVECLYYLSPDEQEMFYRKLVREHAGKIFILTGPIIGANEFRTYFTHVGIQKTFARYGLTFVEWRNLNAYRKAGLGGTIAAVASRLPMSSALLALCPERFVYQRCYVARCSS